MNVRLTQIDGKLPNLALMKLAHWHRTRGDNVLLTKQPEPDLFEPAYDIVYGSAIFMHSADLIERFRRSFPNAIVSGSGVANDGGITVENVIGVPSWSYEHYDYADYADFDASIGFAQRGCRLACKFCGVRGKEGTPRAVNTIAQIWRGADFPKKLHLLDNDFFGVPEWRQRLDEIRAGGFRVCLSQGINIRLINEEQARELATVEYRDTKFRERKLYTAWDNLKDERVFFKGVERLDRAGIPPTHLRVYMLTGFDPTETWDRIWYRFNRMVALGIEPYAMVFDRSRADLKCWQRWVNTGMYRFLSWAQYQRTTKSAESLAAWERQAVPA